VDKFIAETLASALFLATIAVAVALGMSAHDQMVARTNAGVTP
jgi:hypothetical protein